MGSVPMFPDSPRVIPGTRLNQPKVFRGGSNFDSAISADCGGVRREISEAVRHSQFPPDLLIQRNNFLESFWKQNPASRGLRDLFHPYPNLIQISSRHRRSRKHDLEIPVF